MVDRLHGAVALVTGASSGIGQATAVALAEEGASLAVAARRLDRLEALGDRLGQRTAVQVHKTDVTDEEQVHAMVASTVAEFGRLDILINNAGVMLLGPIEHAPTEEWRRMVNLNLLGLLYCTHAALPHLLRAAQDDLRGVADLVNVSSVAGRVARRDSGVYNATKWGVGAFTESFRQEFTTRKVRAALVEPGATATELAGHNRPEVLAEMAKNFSGIERLTSEDIANAVLYVVTQPAHVAVNEVLVRPTDQER
jgi:NADP-dependent 3-hydroxy acid dehydrogenase YdfG